MKTLILIAILGLILWPHGEPPKAFDFDLLGNQNLVQDPPPSKKMPAKSQKKKAVKSQKKPWQPNLQKFKPGDEYAELKKAIEHPSIGTIMQYKLQIIDWQWQYYKAMLKQLEYEYSARCYKDPRYTRFKYKLEELQREARKLLLF